MYIFRGDLKLIRGRVKEPKLFFVVFKVISKREENGADFCGYYNVEKRNKRDRSSV